MRKQGRVRTAIALSVLAGVGLIAVATGYRDDRPCELMDDGTASCGVLLGITTATPTLDELAAAEEFAGRSYDLVYRFHGIDEDFPTEDEQELVASGRALHLSIDTRKGGDWAGYSWDAVVAGAHDHSLRRQARGIADLRRPVFVTYEHEMDQPAKETLGTPAEFIEAWRYVHRIYTEEGATNAVWVWVASGNDYAIANTGPMWPGNDVVDWISWDVYNPAGCRGREPDPSDDQSFVESLTYFEDWLETEGPNFGIDLGKPRMISEMGGVVHRGNIEATAAWYAGVPAALEDRPQIRAITLWDHVGIHRCDYRFTGVEGMRPAIQDLT